MNYHDVEFVTSAKEKSAWPKEGCIEFVLAGRSNVGKSSFINTLVNRKNLAYVGKTPGKTRLLNFFKIDNRFMLVDVPGYGYATRGQKEFIAFGQMMDEYFSLREELKGLFMIVDFRHKPTKDDVEMVEYARSNHIATFIVATKADKIKNSQWHTNLKVIAETLNVSKDSIIPFSSVTSLGVDVVWKKLEKLLTSE
ncbi:YihA family ribosome biogenesis GTP-binding protein [Erysipelotrichaceae bacterium OH741_COT-311]|nr:YihA family ribosome biogenesis GTP-binding protein [Erysipelotrichaceae bacterium OH741_COT-311]